MEFLVATNVCLGDLLDLTQPRRSTGIVAPKTLSLRACVVRQCSTSRISKVEYQRGFAQI